MSKDKYETLKPCPFCGNEPWGIFGPHPDIGDYWVECHGPDDDKTVCGDWYYEADTKQEIAKAWNKRGYRRKQLQELTRLTEEFGGYEK